MFFVEKELMTDPKARNLTWHQGELAPEVRRKAYGHGAALVWLTGLPGSGKSTIANRVEKVLVERSVFACVLDGDNVRHGLCSDLGFSREDRAENIRRVVRWPSSSRAPARSSSR